MITMGYGLGVFHFGKRLLTNLNEETMVTIWLRRFGECCVFWNNSIPYLECYHSSLELPS
jgi:hypothetical protein